MGKREGGRQFTFLKENERNLKRKLTGRDDERSTDDPIRRGSLTVCMSEPDRPTLCHGTCVNGRKGSERDENEGYF